jgi:SAM-dependent methyltransferase
VPRERLAQRATVVCEQVDVRGSVLAQEARRSLDVGEEKGDGSRRQSHGRDPRGGVSRRSRIRGVDREEYRRTSLANWATMAAGWERRRADIEKVSAPVSEWLVRHLAPQPGDTVLELAAGPGDVGFAAVPMIGEEGRLISTDFSPEMVEVGRRRAAELGLTNVEHRVIDAERIELEDDSVDGVLCRFGYMLMADPAAAFSETRRVLRSGGRLALAVWRDAAQNPWVAIAGRVLVESGHAPPPEPGSPGIFSMASDERLETLLEGAGFTLERVEDVPVRFRYGDVEEYILNARDTGGMFARAWRDASENERQAMKVQLGEAFTPFSVEGGYELPGVSLCVAAT